MYHTIIIVGNLGRDPEMRYTPNGQAVTNLNIFIVFLLGLLLELVSRSKPLAYVAIPAKLLTKSANLRLA